MCAAVPPTQSQVSCSKRGNAHVAADRGESNTIDLNCPSIEVCACTGALNKINTATPQRTPQKFAPPPQAARADRLQRRGAECLEFHSRIDRLASSPLSHTAHPCRKAIRHRLLLSLWREHSSAIAAPDGAWHPCGAQVWLAASKWRASGAGGAWCLAGRRSRHASASKPAARSQA